MKNIFVSPPSGGGGTAPNESIEVRAIGDAGRLDALKTKARRHGAKRSYGEWNYGPLPKTLESRWSGR